MRFGILGPTEVRPADGRPVPVGGPRLRALLALLLLTPDRVVTTTRLIEGLYGDDPPAGAGNALQAQISRLRHLLDTAGTAGTANDAAGGGANGGAGGGRGMVTRHPAGYRLAVPPEAVDAHRFERLARQGRAALASGRHERAGELLGEALGLWRGPALADVLNAPFATAAAARLEEARIAAAEDHAEARLALGRHREPIAGLRTPVTDLQAPVADLQASVTDLQAPVADLRTPVADLRTPAADLRTLVADLHELVAAHPLRERLRGQLMRALYACDRQAEALAVYEDVRARLADELGADPSPELRAIHLSVLRGTLPVPGPDVPPAGNRSPRSGDGAGTRARVPAQLTPLVGRADELARIGGLLAGSRLVTLTGPGGTGKTRLAAEAAAHGHDDVCFVELAPLTDGSDVPRAVLGALGLHEPGMLPAPGGAVPDPVVRMVAALAERRTLLVLDNCEHVVEAAAALAARLLSGCPGLRVLATSREPLGITGETLCPVPPLMLPPPDVPAAEALGFPAVRLFAERAAAVRPGYAVESEADAVLRVCRALDGLPLAIELAAARLRSLTAAEVAARLDDRFRLLSRGSRTAQPRHRTLRAAVEWSWDLLDEDERTMAGRLTVFAGGATLEAVERVTGMPDAVDLLAGLVDKSLVEVVGDRYRMLDTIRAFCAERLADAGEEEALRRAHGEYFLGLAESADPHLRDAEQLEWLRRLDREYEDLRATVHRAVLPAEVPGTAGSPGSTGSSGSSDSSIPAHASGSPGSSAPAHALGSGSGSGSTRSSGSFEPVFALRLLSALTPYWWLRGLRGEAAAPARRLLDRIGLRPPAGAEEEYALCVFLAASAGRHDPRLRPHVEVAEAIIAGLDGTPRQPFTLVVQAVVLGMPEGDLYLRSIRRLDRLGLDPWTRALLDFGYGYHWWSNGRPVEAEHDFEASLKRFRSLGDRWGTVTALTSLAELAIWRRDDGRAAGLVGEAMSLAEELGATTDLADLLCRRAELNVRAGDLDGARDGYERAAGFARRAGDPATLAGARLGLGEVARIRGDLAGARACYETALAGCDLEGYLAEEVRGRLRVALGRLAEMEGDAREALDRHLSALSGTAWRRNPPLAALATEGLAGVALLEGDGERAAFLLGLGAALRGVSVPAGPDDPDVARVGAGARALAGDAVFEAAHRRGGDLTIGRALDALDRIRTGAGEPSTPRR
ncbi:BTAD domain-containing putative transcriptional regulator [Streptosporangium sp. NPDC048047]|uniref:AfsR/SARP family transcriptional regulator n=1 Tax=Streptosporangium sp. NPDC048047 TaxID=3155748 RepID=UPI00341644B9